jgi:hypothetical protein
VLALALPARDPARLPRHTAVHPRANDLHKQDVEQPGGHAHAAERPARLLAVKRCQGACEIRARDARPQVQQRRQELEHGV